MRENIWHVGKISSILDALGLLIILINFTVNVEIIYDVVKMIGLYLLPCKCNEVAFQGEVGKEATHSEPYLKLLYMHFKNIVIKINSTHRAKIHLA